MLVNRYSPEDEDCPVSDELLGELYNASKLDLHALVASMAPEIRPMLALFCYHRSHLHNMGLAIAATCHEDDLVRSGGTVGAALFVSSRAVPPAVPSHSASRQNITLASGPLRTIGPLNDEPDDEVTVTEF